MALKELQPKKLFSEESTCAAKQTVKTVHWFLWHLDTPAKAAL
jgi:hypothetical protein